MSRLALRHRTAPIASACEPASHPPKAGLPAGLPAMTAHLPQADRACVSWHARRGVVRLAPNYKPLLRCRRFVGGLGNSSQESMLRALAPSDIFFRTCANLMKSRGNATLHARLVCVAVLRLATMLAPDVRRPVKGDVCVAFVTFSRALEAVGWLESAREAMAAAIRAWMADPARVGPPLVQGCIVTRVGGAGQAGPCACFLAHPRAPAAWGRGRHIRAY